MSKRNHEFFQHLQTHNQFNSGLPSLDSPDESQEVSKSDLLTKLQSETPQSVLFLAMLYHTCSIYEPQDVSRRKVFFQAVCQYLSMKKYLNVNASLLANLVIDKPEAIEAISLFIQHVYKKTLPQLPTLNYGPNNRLACLPSQSSIQSNRYDDSFVEESEIAHGGFGIVCKARNKVDGVIYAVKKIFFKYKNDHEFEKIIREAKSFASLQHRNIVHYNHAWLENTDDTQKSEFESEEEEESEKQEELDDINESHSKTSWDISFRNEKMEESSEVNKETKISTSSTCTVYEKRTYYLSSNNIVETTAPNSTNGVSNSRRRHSSGATCLSSDFKEDDPVDYENNKSFKQIFLNAPLIVTPFINIKATLYIQMEYCDCDLGTWMDECMKGDNDNSSKKMYPLNIFRQILCGVEHIHSKSIIHRDLKPKNIFISKKDGTVKIGDFGLACLVGQANDDGTNKQSLRLSASPHQSAVLGTHPYAAPEQEKGERYDYKVDIYSSGIILFELLNPCSTRMEFFNCVKKMLSGQFPEQFEEEQVVELVKGMVQKNAAERPTASYILTNSVFAKKSLKKKIEALKTKTSKLDSITQGLEKYVIELKNIQSSVLKVCLEENENLKKANKDQQEEIQQLRLKIIWLENYIAEIS